MLFGKIGRGLAKLEVSNLAEERKENLLPLIDFIQTKVSKKEVVRLILSERTIPEEV